MSMNLRMIYRKRTASEDMDLCERGYEQKEG